MTTRKPTKKLEEEFPHLAQFFPFLNQLNDESSRGKAIISGSYLDDLLSNIIASFLIVGSSSKRLLEGYSPPIGSFSARIDMAYSLGLIKEKEKHELDLIRKIRNRFAHDVNCNFDDPKIIDWCKNLQMDAKPYGDMKWTANGAFSTSAVCLILNLTNRSHYVSERRLKWQDWPY